MNSGNSDEPPEGAESSGNAFEIPTQPPPEASSDDRAESEAAALAFSLPLEDAKTKRRIQRLIGTARLDGVISWVLSSLVVIAAIFLVVAFGVLFWHLLAPDCWLFLSLDRVAELRAFLFNGTFGAGLAALWSSQKRSEDQDTK